jgi:hypothetical protein
MTISNPIKLHQGCLGLQVTQYSGALGKPCTSITIDRKVLSILHLTCVVLYLVLSSTVDQTVTTVLVQLGTGEVPELDL